MYLQHSDAGTGAESDHVYCVGGMRNML